MDEIKKSSGSKLLKNNMESIILRALFDGKKYGYEIAKDIEEKTEGAIEVKQPTLYNVLKRLESNGLVTSFWGDESQGGRRKYFSLTIEGFQLCQKQQTDWEFSRHLLDKLVSNKEFDGDKVNPDIDISIDKKTVRAQKPSAKKRISFEKEQTEVLDIIEDISNDLSSLPNSASQAPAQTATEAPLPLSQETEINALDTEYTPSTEVVDTVKEEPQKPLDLDEETGSNLFEGEYFIDDGDIVSEDEHSSPVEYYRELDRNIDALMDDIDEVDDTIMSTDSLLESLSKKTEKKPEPVREQAVYSELGHINKDYLFNLYGLREQPKAEPAPPAVVIPAPRVYDDEPLPEPSGMSFSAARDNAPVDIFEDGGELRRKSPTPPVETAPVISIEPQRESPPPTMIAAEEPEPFVDYDALQEESHEEREYKKIISNLLYKKTEEEIEESPQHSISKTQPSTADKIMSSVGAATHSFNLDGFESTGDMPSVALTYPGGMPVGYDIIYDLKERLGNEGIKLRQYEKATKTTTERYDYYYKNKLLFAALWIVYLFVLVELTAIYLIFKSRVEISAQLLLTYALIMLTFPLAGTVINYSHNNLKVKAEWDFGFRLRDSLIMFILGFFVIVAVDLIFFQFAFAVTDDVIKKLTIPSVMLFNVVLITFVYRSLYRSKRYFVK